MHVDNARNLLGINMLYGTEKRFVSVKYCVAVTSLTGKFLHFQGLISEVTSYWRRERGKNAVLAITGKPGWPRCVRCFQ